MTDDQEIVVGGSQAVEAASTRVDDMKTIGAIIDTARRVIDEKALVYAEAGAGEGVTVARNREAIRQLAFRPRVLRDVSTIDTTTTFLGIPLGLPVILAPVGSVGLFDPDGEAAAATAAVAESTVSMAGMLSRPRYDEVVRRCGQPQIFQVYLRGDRRWLRDLAHRVSEAGARAICITVDSPGASHRDAILQSGYDYETGRDYPNVDWFGKESEGEPLDRRFDWNDLERFCGEIDLPVVLKGVIHPDDAVRAVSAGVAAIYVSNHGGRAIDHGVSAMEALPGVVDAVDVDVVVDGSFTRGTDVLKAVALGATAAGIGRLQCWGLAAGGVAGLRRVLQILQREMQVTMTRIGCATLPDVSSDMVVRTFSPSDGREATSTR